MNTTITQAAPAEYDLHLTAEASELSAELDKATRAQRARTQLKGFRPGKVPMSMVKKMHGEALAYGVAENKIREVYEAEVMESDEYEVLGQPVITALDFGLDKDLDATIRFGVRPEIALKDFSTIEVDKPIADVSDEDVDREVERLRRKFADLAPLEEGEVIEEDGQVIVDLQRLDDDGEPIIDMLEEDVELMLDDDRVQDALKEALLGKKQGDTARIELGHEDHTHPYEVTIKEAKRAELPDLDEDFFSEASEEEFTDEESFRANVREQLENAFDEASREFVEGRTVEALMRAHDVPVPSSVVGIFLDSFVEDVKQQNDGELPAGFDERAFRHANAPQALQQGRWMLLRDRIVEELGIEVTEDDQNEYLAGLLGGAGTMNPEQQAQMMQYFRMQPGMMEQMQQRMMSKKVFDAILERVTLVEKDIEAIREEDEAREAAARAEADAKEEAAFAAAEAADAADAEEADFEVIDEAEAPDAEVDAEKAADASETDASETETKPAE